MSSFLLFSLAGFAVLAITVLIEYAIRKKWLPYFEGRKLLHLMAIGTTAWIIDMGHEAFILGVALCLAGFLLMLVLIKFKWGLQQEASYGIGLFPISLGGLLILGVSSDYVATAAWILAVSDACAGIVGRKWGNPRLIFLSESKSYQGALAFFITAGICMGIRYPDLHWVWWIILAFLPTITELFSWRGSDNFFLPVFTVGWIHLVLRASHSDARIWMPIAVVFLMILGWWVIRRRWLDQSGWWAALWVAAVLWMSGGWEALFAPVFLLVTGSVAGRLFRKSHSSEERSAQQVFANGWIGAVLYMIYGVTNQETWLVMAWCSYAISICDTVSSEVGTAVGGKTFDIGSFRVMQPGLSGGVSAAGTVGGLVALLLLVTCLNFLLPVNSMQLFWVVVTGMLGMLLDSYLGSRWQALWKQGNQWVETQSDRPGAQLVKGVAWLDNHWVNFLSNALMMVGSCIFYVLLVP